MSGHSKWSTIKHQKGALDQKRGQIFTKLAQSITLSVVQGGGSGNPNDNFKLRLAIEKARQANMPKDNIERAISRALEIKNGVGLSEVTYEGYGPGGTAIIITAATDNRARTYTEVKNAFERGDGTLGGQGTVSYMFEQKGLLTILKGTKSLEEVELLLIDFGVEDIEETENSILAFTKPHELMHIKSSIEEAGLTISDAEITMKPSTSVVISDLETVRKVVKLIETLEDLNDVQKVHSNFDTPNEVLVQL